MRLYICFFVNNTFSSGRSRVEHSITYDVETKKFTLEKDDETIRCLKKKQILDDFQNFIDNYIVYVNHYIIKIQIDDGNEDDYYSNSYEYIETWNENYFRTTSNKIIKKFLKDLVDFTY